MISESLIASEQNRLIKHYNSDEINEMFIYAKNNNKKVINS